MIWKILPVKKLAVFSIEGKIGNNTNSILYILEKLRKNPRIKGIILKINSPGGNASSGELIYKSIKRLSLEKTVVAYFQEIATSVGYEIACPAKKIVAPERCLVGSIGVITTKISLKKLFEKIGINLFYITSGIHKDMFEPHRDLTAREKEIIQNISDEIYESFVSNVAEDRKIPIEKVKKIATGEVFTGKKAKDLNLIDENGNLEDAIKIASELTGVPMKRTLYFATRKSFLQILIQKVVYRFISETYEAVMYTIDSNLYI